jgi:hypothetical protein
MKAAWPFWAATIALAGAVLAPLARPPRWDDYPFSRYPMFSRGDIGRVVVVSHAHVVDGEGRHTPASPALVGAPNEPMVAKGIVENAIRRAAAMDLCVAIAKRVRDEEPASSLPAVAVEIVTSQFDSTRYFTDQAGRTPLARDIHATCAVPR